MNFIVIVVERAEISAFTGFISLSVCAFKQVSFMFKILRQVQEAQNCTSVF